MKNGVFERLNKRGYIYQATHLEEIKKAVNEQKVTFYIGIDPTADSLHIGHFFALMMFRHLQEAGHRGIVVIGGATALVGDPTGKSDLRKILTKEEVEKNLEEVKHLVEKFVITDGDNSAIILNNNDWIGSYSYVDFMRDIGIHFNVNQMLAAETYANRLKEGGLTFLEMGYMLMQAYDFVYLNKKYDCVLQVGGSDQWGNIVAGTSLGRKLNFKEGEERDIMFGLTCPLLMTKEGKKMGKSEQGTLWVARDKTTVFDFYQYFYNVNDEDTEMLLKLFTRIEDEEIDNICKNDIIEAKRIMAYEVTKLVHGEDEAVKVLESVKSLFGKGANAANIPSVNIDKTKYKEGINILDLLTVTEFLPSKSEARRMVQQGGIAIDGEKISSIDFVFEFKTDKNEALIKKGKKYFLKLCF